MSDELQLFSSGYLQYIIDNYGENQEILSTNCNGNPTKPGDYSINYGRAGELKKRAEAYLEERKEVVG